MKKLVPALYTLFLLGSYALPLSAAKKKKASFNTMKTSRSRSRTNPKFIFAAVVGSVCILAFSSAGVYMWRKKRESNPGDPSTGENGTSSYNDNLPHSGHQNVWQKKGVSNLGNPTTGKNGTCSHNDNLAHSAYKYEFNTDTVVTEQTIPVIRLVAWGKLIYEKWDSQQNKRIAFKQPSNQSKRADAILSKNGYKLFDWGKYNVSHKEGYSDKALKKLRDENPGMTHLLLSAGWQAQLHLRKNQKVGKVGPQTIGQIAKTLRGDKNINKVTFVQTMEKYNALEKCEEGELIVVFLRTGEIAGIYNELIQDPENEVVLALHTTC